MRAPALGVEHSPFHVDCNLVWISCTGYNRVYREILEGKSRVHVSLRERGVPLFRVVVTSSRQAQGLAGSSSRRLAGGFGHYGPVFRRRLEVP